METVSDFIEDWITLWEYTTIKKAMKEHRVIDLDSIYKDGKLFGRNIICNLICEDETQIPQFKLDYYREEDGKHYILDYNFDWKYESFILSYIKFENGIQYKARIQINFHMLFSVKPGIEQMVFERAAESVIREVEKLIDDDKKDNRNS